MRYLLLFILLLSGPVMLRAQNKHTISGYVREQGSGELLMAKACTNPAKR